ncbi:MAG: hypothetical protein R2863_08305 [Candidatus Kapaibacterium sp.]
MKGFSSIFVALGVAMSLLTVGMKSEAEAQVGDICPLKCGNTPIQWDFELTGMNYHNPFMNLYKNGSCCIEECVDFFWKNYECDSVNNYALHIRKIYTHTHAYPVVSVQKCELQNKLVYLNHLKGLLTFMIFNNSNPLLPSFWDFSTNPPTPPWIDSNNPTDFRVKVFQPYCWGLFPEEHTCSDITCTITAQKKMVLEPCDEESCPCCNFEYFFHYENYGNGFVEITNVIHNSEHLEYKCENEDCCFSCGVEIEDKWTLDEKTELHNVERKCP